MALGVTFQRTEGTSATPNVQESRAVIDVFLENLPTMFDGNTAERSCLGPALKAAYAARKQPSVPLRERESARAESARAELRTRGR